MNKIECAKSEIIKEYPYLYETHLHTKEASKCAKNSAEDIVRAYKSAGYTGVIITDHHYGGNTAIDRNLPYEDFVSEFFSGYRNAKQAGENTGLDVFCGWEAGFNSTEFLIYGLGEQWLKNHPEMNSCTVSEQFEIVSNAGGMVIHAHPFRKRNYIKQIRLYPEFVHGVEGINASHTDHTHHKEHENEIHLPENEDHLANIKAFEYAKSHNLPVTAGSDMHSTNLFDGAGMRFKKKLTSINDFIDAVMSFGKTNEYILSDGENFYSI